MGGSDWMTGGGLFAGMPMMTGKQIYENFQSGTGSASLHGASREVQKLGKDYGELQQSIEDLMTQMKPHWKGKAGGLARHGAGPIAVEFAAAKPKLNTTQDLVRRQGELFDRTKGNVVPVPDKPEAPSGWGSMLAEGASVVFLGHDTGEVQDYETQLSAHNDAAQHNVDQMHQYSTGSDYNTTNLPDSYGKMLGSEGEIRIDHSGGGDSNTGTYNGTGNTPGSTIGGYQGYTPGGYDNGGTQPGGTVPGTNGDFHGPPQPSGDPADSTSTTGASAVPGGTPPGYTPGQPPGPNGWNQSLAARGPAGPGGGGFGGSPGGMYAGGGDFGGNGTGSGGGYGRSGGRGPGGSPGAGEEPGSGSRSGIGRGARPATGGTSAAEQAAGRSGSGRGGRMMPGSGRKGGGDDDHEHETPSYLVEPEPDKFWFGDQPKIAPPCIGE